MTKSRRRCPRTAQRVSTRSPGWLSRNQQHRGVQSPDGRDDGNPSDLGQAGRHRHWPFQQDQASFARRARRRASRRTVSTPAGLVRFEAIRPSTPGSPRRVDPSCCDLRPAAAQTPIETIVRLAHDKGSLVYVDDVAVRRVGPAAFGSAADAGAWGRSRCDRFRRIRHIRAALGLSRARRIWSPIRVKGFEFGVEDPADALPGGRADTRTIQPGASSSADRDDEADCRAAPSAARQPAA